MNKRSCPMCGGRNKKEIRKLFFVKQKGNPLPEEYTVVTCEVCGFCFSDMNASQESFNKYYTEYNVYAEAESLRSMQVESKVYNKSVQLIKKCISPDKKIIDIGCGEGKILQKLKEVGYTNLYGMDPSRHSIERIKACGIYGIQANIFDDVPVEYMHQFDLVISTAVAEHIYDLKLYYQNIQKYMKEETAYFLTNVPDAEGFKEGSRPIANYFNQEHINFFTIKSLDAVLDSYSFVRVNEDVYEYESGNDKQIIGLYRLETNKIQNAICKDDTTYRAIVEFFDLAEKRDKARISIIRDLTEKDKKIVIFGAGQYAMQLLSQYPELKKNLLFFVDNNSVKWKMKFGNKEVKSPEILESLEEDVVVVICSMQNGMEINEQIKGIGIENHIMVL